MSKTESTYKMTIRLSPLTEYRLERDYRLDGSRSRNEFIERAIVRYLDFLEAEQSETLPVAIQSAIDGRMGMFEDRLSSLLYKHSVELDMVMGLLADAYELTEEEMRRRRADSVRNVKGTNGRLSFEQKVRSADETEDEWPD